MYMSYIRTQLGLPWFIVFYHMKIRDSAIYILVDPASPGDGDALPKGSSGNDLRPSS